MKLALAALVAAAFSTVSWGQGGLFDKVAVQFPHPVHVGDHLLAAGQYEFRQLQSSTGGSQVMIVSGDNGLHFETAVIPVPIVANNTPDKTTATVQQVVTDYYLERIWIAGKDYGYEFPIADDVRSRIEENRGNQPIRVWLLYTAPVNLGPIDTSRSR